MRSGPSTVSESTAIGTGGTIDHHSVRCNGFDAPARRVATLPIAHPSAPQSASTTGSSAAACARCTAIAARAHTATVTPMTCRPVRRSRRNTPASTTVNGAEAWSTSDASPDGIPDAMLR